MISYDAPNAARQLVAGSDLKFPESGFVALSDADEKIFHRRSSFASGAAVEFPPAAIVSER
jgi:hypothetical protein